MLIKSNTCNTYIIQFLQFSALLNVTNQHECEAIDRAYNYENARALYEDITFQENIDILLNSCTFGREALLEKNEQCLGHCTVRKTCVAASITQLSNGISCKFCTLSGYNSSNSLTADDLLNVFVNMTVLSGMYSFKYSKNLITNL